MRGVGQKRRRVGEKAGYCLGGYKSEIERDGDAITSVARGMMVVNVVLVLSVGGVAVHRALYAVNHSTQQAPGDTHAHAR